MDCENREITMELQHILFYTTSLSFLNVICENESATLIIFFIGFDVIRLLGKVALVRKDNDKFILENENLVLSFSDLLDTSLLPVLKL